MTGKVIPLRQDGIDFPDLFPWATYGEVAYALLRNVPFKVEHVAYDYALKVNDPAASVVAIILQPGGNVLFNPCTHHGDNTRLKRWVDTHTVALQSTAKGINASTTIVGKCRGSALYVYYVIHKGHCYFDEPSIHARLGTYRDSPYGSDLVVLPVLRTSTLNVNRKGSTVFMAPLLDHAHLVAFPVTTEERDGSTNPRMYADAMLMRYLGFVFDP